MQIQFNKYVRDGEQFIKEVAIEMADPDNLDRAGRILRAVLHTLRNRLPASESLQMISQLPMLIKAIYVDGWRLGDEAQFLRTPGDFIEGVREAGGRGTHQEFVTDREVGHAIQAVFRVLKNHVSEGEIRDIMATVPEALWPLLGLNSER